MIVGAHVMLQSKNEKADQAFMEKVLKLPFVNAGNGFMIYGMPPSEVAIHESDSNDKHTLYLMCENIASFTGHMTKHGIAFSTPANRGWGTLTEITLPGGGKLGVYQPHHARSKQTAAPAKKAPAKKKPAKKPAKRKTKAKKRR